MGPTRVTAAVSTPSHPLQYPVSCIEDSKQVGSMTQSRDLPRRPEMRWPPALSPDSFPINRIDVWRVSLDSPSAEEDKESVLSSDEIARADRFHFEKDQLHFSERFFSSRERAKVEAIARGTTGQGVRKDHDATHGRPHGRR